MAQISFRIGNPIEAFRNSPWISDKPKDYIREYDPTGEYTYKDQNPLFK